MSERTLAVFAVLVLAAFLGILLWHVPRLDLGVLVAITLALVLWDIGGRVRPGG